MAFTAADVITGARDILQDTLTGAYRYTDDSLIRVLNLALREARRVRPDLFFRAASLPVVTSGNLADASLLGIDDQYQAPFVLFVAGFAELREDQFASDGRAATLLARFSTSLQGVA